MVFHFPPSHVNHSDTSFLSVDDSTFAKLKIESKTQKRTVFLTEHTLILVLKGAKLLHFPEKTIRVEKGHVALLKKGVYAMAEYIEEGLSFEALLVFLSDKIIKDATIEKVAVKSRSENKASFVILPTNEHIDIYTSQLRRYFDTPMVKDKDLLQLKQKEILLLLKGINSTHLTGFLLALPKNAQEDIETIVDKHLLQELSIADYANLSNRSITSFKRDFRKIYDASPRQWINQKRLEHAYLLLNNTTDRISEISDACGFESASYFIKLFKKQYGYTPSSLRSKLAIN